MPWSCYKSVGPEKSMDETDGVTMVPGQFSKHPQPGLLLVRCNCIRKTTRKVSKRLRRKGACTEPTRREDSGPLNVVLVTILRSCVFTVIPKTGDGECYVSLISSKSPFLSLPLPLWHVNLSPVVAYGLQGQG
jgi:hypothetical protein